jgi:hypothetical protein
VQKQNSLQNSGQITQPTGRSIKNFEKS